MDFNYVLNRMGEREGRPKKIHGSIEAMTVTIMNKFAVLARFDSCTVSRFL